MRLKKQWIEQLEERQLLSNTYLNIVPHWDGSVLRLPPAQQEQFENAFNFAALQFENLFPNTHLTLDFDVVVNTDTNNFNSATGGAALGYTYINPAEFDVVPYSTIQPLLPGLPSANPLSPMNGMVAVPSAEAQLLNLPGFVPGSIDATITFTLGDTFNLNPADRAGSDINSGDRSQWFDFIGVAEHEISHAMGRYPLMGQIFSQQSNPLYTPADLFRYSPSTHAIDVNPVDSVYYSTVMLGGLNSYSRFFASGTNVDYSDWAAGTPVDAFDAGQTSAVTNEMSIGDVALMSSLGYVQGGLTTQGFQTGDNAVITSVTFQQGTVPVTSLFTGSSYLVTATVLNTGTTTWYGNQNLWGITISQNTPGVGSIPQAGGWQPINSGATIAPGSSATLQFAYHAAGTGTVPQFQMIHQYSGWFGETAEATVSGADPITAQDSAQLYSELFSTTPVQSPSPVTFLVPGQTYYVQLKYLNMGTSNWTTGSVFGLVAFSGDLGIQAPGNVVYVSSTITSFWTDNIISAAHIATFTFQYTAPLASQRYGDAPGVPQFGMIHQGQHYFGDVAAMWEQQTQTANPSHFDTFQSIQIANANAPLDPNHQPQMVNGNTYLVYVTFTNTGNQTWTGTGTTSTGSIGVVSNTPGDFHALPLGVIVYPGQSYTFSITYVAKAPNASWIMYIFNVGAVGGLSSTLTVNAGSGQTTQLDQAHLANVTGTQNGVPFVAPGVQILQNGIPQTVLRAGQTYTVNVFYVITGVQNINNVQLTWFPGTGAGVVATPVSLGNNLYVFSFSFVAPPVVNGVVATSQFILVDQQIDYFGDVVSLLSFADSTVN